MSSVGLSHADGHLISAPTAFNDLGGVSYHMPTALVGYTGDFTLEMQVTRAYHNSDWYTGLVRVPMAGAGNFLSVGLDDAGSTKGRLFLVVAGTRLDTNAYLSNGVPYVVSVTRRAGVLRAWLNRVPIPFTAGATFSGAAAASALSNGSTQILLLNHLGPLGWAQFIGSVGYLRLYVADHLGS